MEYNFEENGKNIKVILDAYSLIYKSKGQVFKIRYAQINKVRLKKPFVAGNNKLYEAIVYVTDGPKLKFQSFSKSEYGIIDQFETYTQFIRVFHMHLISKSKAAFRYGMSSLTMVVYAVIASLTILLSYLISLQMETQGYILLALPPFVITYLIYKIISNYPGKYRPDIIPGHILPSKC